MIPVEYLWLAVTLLFAIIGLARGLWRELGVSTILLLSLFALNVGERLILEKLSSNLPAGLLANAPAGSIKALYYCITTLFVSFIAYQGITLEFPVKKQKGILKWIFGYLGGLINGYLIVGTIWDVINQARYFGLKVPQGTTGNMIEISAYLTGTHNTVVKYLPVTLMNSNDFIPYVFLAVGMILLLAIILK